LKLCDRYFTYRSTSQADIRVVLGDARMSMERQEEQKVSQQFDVLAVDAFAGDAIPVHLLTKECYAAYAYHLKPDGILAIHVSNRYFDLKPVVRGLAGLNAATDTSALWIDGAGSEAQETDSSDWVLLTRNEGFLEKIHALKVVREWTPSDPAPVLWTDDFSNLFSRMRK
jgi:spermidine synthase